MNDLHQKRRVKDQIEFFPSAWIIGIMTLVLCIIPLALTPDNSADTALILSSFTLRPHFFSGKNQKQSFNQSEDILAALTIYLEARGESFAGKLAVAAVIRNRMIYKYPSDGSVKGTVLRAKQFEPWITRNPDDMIFDPTNQKMKESLLETSSRWAEYCGWNYFTTLN